MNKHIHIHIHRTTDADGPAHAPAGSPKGGQFVSGSGGSGGGKSGSSEKKGAPAIPTKHSNRGATALAQMQAASNKHLEQTGKGHVVKGKEATRAEAEHGSDVEEAKKRVAARKKPSDPVKHDDWAKRVSETHKGAEFKKDAKRGRVNAFVGTKHVGHYQFGAGLAPASHSVADK